MLSRRLLRIKVVKALFAHLKSGADNMMASEKTLMASVDKAYDLYFQILILPVEIARYAEQRQELAKQKKLPTFEDLNPNTKFVDNAVIRTIANSDAVNDHIAARKLGWAKYPELIRTLYTQLTESDYYKELNEKLRELTVRVRDIKSVTIGVNLDSTLRADKCGVLSINPRPFKSGDTIDKILRMSFANDEYTLAAPLSPFAKGQNDNQKTAMSIALSAAINDIFKGSVRAWKKIVQSYVLDNANFLLEVMPEIEFMICAVRLMESLRSRGLPLCTPVLSDTPRTFRAKGLYNPAVALAIEGESVENDFAFDTDGMIYVLTGPNRGGKSVITCAVGLAAAFCQLGLLVPAREFVYAPADGIYTHFPTESGDTVDKGRLGEECARLGEIFAHCTADSLVLLDESLSSTGAFEASYIAAEVLLGFSKVGCRTVFSTHLHTLAARVDELNRDAAAFGGARIDTLVAKIEEGGRRSFKILRMKPDGKSYAKDIADKYGLSFEKITETIERKKGDA